MKQIIQKSKTDPITLVGSIILSGTLLSIVSLFIKAALSSNSLIAHPFF